jgi:hypothetical protein
VKARFAGGGRGLVSFEGTLSARRTALLAGKGTHL